jgi:hypothetical protein
MIIPVLCVPVFIQSDLTFRSKMFIIYGSVNQGGEGILFRGSVPCLSLCSRLGGVVVKCAYHWTQGSRVQTRPRWWIFKGDKNPQYAFLRMKVKPEVPCHKILRHVKYPFKYQRYWIREILFPASIPPTCPRRLCFKDCQKAPVHESGVIHSRHHHHHGSHTHIHPGIWK